MRLVRILAALALLATFVTSPRAQEQAAAKVKPPLRSWQFSLLGGLGQYSPNLSFPTDSLADAPIVGLRL